MSLRTNVLLRKFAYVKQAIQHRVAVMSLPAYIRYHPIHVKPKAGEHWQAIGETWEDDRTAMLAAEALGINLKEYGFDPSCEGTEMEPTPVPEVEFTEWNDLPPPVDTE